MPLPSQRGHSTEFPRVERRLFGSKINDTKTQEAIFIVNCETLGQFARIQVIQLFRKGEVSRTESSTIAMSPTNGFIR